MIWQNREFVWNICAKKVKIEAANALKYLNMHWLCLRDDYISKKKGKRKVHNPSNQNSHTFIRHEIHHFTSYYFILIYIMSETMFSFVHKCVACIIMQHGYTQIYIEIQRRKSCLLRLRKWLRLFSKLTVTLPLKWPRIQHKHNIYWNHSLVYLHFVPFSHASTLITITKIKYTTNCVDNWHIIVHQKIKIKKKMMDYMTELKCDVY